MRNVKSAIEVNLTRVTVGSQIFRSRGSRRASRVQNHLRWPRWARREKHRRSSRLPSLRYAARCPEPRPPEHCTGGRGYYRTLTSFLRTVYCTDLSSPGPGRPGDPVNQDLFQDNLPAGNLMNLTLIWTGRDLHTKFKSYQCYLDYIHTKSQLLQDAIWTINWTKLNWIMTLLSSVMLLLDKMNCFQNLYMFWPFIVASLRHTCAIIMLSNQHLDMPHLWGGWIISFTNTDLHRFVNNHWEK